LRNEETGNYHLYLTNVPADWLSAEEIGAAYACRWEVERLFAEFKGPYDLGAWSVTREEAMLAHVYGVLIAWAVSGACERRSSDWMSAPMLKRRRWRRPCNDGPWPCGTISATSPTPSSGNVPPLDNSPTSYATHRETPIGEGYPWPPGPSQSAGTRQSRRLQPKRTRMRLLESGFPRSE
jgi:hypothetical protein